MKVIGVTGSFGTGKTFVSSIFRNLGANVIDADKISRGTLKRGSAVYRKIIKTFGVGVLTRGNIDRKKLAGIVFKSRGALDRLNKIIHPEVIRMIKGYIKKARPDSLVVIDAPLLIEAKALGLVDKLVVVTASTETQIERAAKKFGLEKSEVVLRIKKQMPIKEKVRLADFVVDNDGPRAATREQVKEIWGRLWK